MASQFADFVYSLFRSLFSHLVALFIAGCVSGGSPFHIYATQGLDSVFLRVCFVGLEDYFLSQT